MADTDFDLSRYYIPTQLHIDGKWVDSSSKQREKIISAVNDQVISTDVQWATAHDVDLAVDSAERALPLWQEMSTTAKRDCLLKWAELIKAHIDQLYWLEAIVTGKPKSFAYFEVDGLYKHLIFAAGLLEFPHGKVTVANDNTLQYTIREPWGICAAMVPFNGPIICLGNKIGAALAGGNAVIVKCPETNPFSTLLAVSLATEAGIPPGLLNVINGGSEAGAALASHMKIRKISFTGSLSVARQIQIAAAKSNLKNVVLELGGKSPVIVFPDANLDEAAQVCTQYLMIAGQGCMLATRVYVHEDVMEDILSRVVKITDAYEANLGADPLAGDTWTSPLFHHAQKRNVLRFIEEGKKEATLYRGDSTLGNKGCYIKPTIFLKPSPNARILKEEIFGPVVVMMTFKTEEEVIRLANDSEYGLGSFLFTNDLSRALRFARKLEAGTVGVNGTHWSVYTPFGGWKQSGSGVECGVEGYEDWTQIKSVQFKSSPSIVSAAAS